MAPQRIGTLMVLLCILTINSTCVVACSSVVGTWNISGKSTVSGGGEHVTAPLQGSIKFLSNGTFTAAPAGFQGTWHQKRCAITATLSEASIKRSLIGLFKQAGIVVTIDSVGRVKASLSLAGRVVKGSFSYVVRISVPGTSLRNVKITASNVFNGTKR